MNLNKLVYGLVLITPCLLFTGFTGGAELKSNTQDFATHNYEVGGGVSGPAADIIRRICSEAKIDCSMHLLPWRRAQDEVANGTAHGLFVIGWNEERPSGKPRFPIPPWNQD
jgi:polar amino acid transport system substrate-binding protein